jgi:hypothetical protein
MKKYYQLLGLTESATDAEIKRNYRKLAFEYHPDRNSSASAQEKFILIQEAYEIVTGKKKIPQQRVGDYSSRRTRQDESWEEKVKKARSKYEENKRHQEQVIANYFIRLRTGWRWHILRVSAIVGLVISLCMLVDLFLPNHQTEERVLRYSKEVYSSVGSAQISLIETANNEKMWVQTQNYSLYRHNNNVLVERSWIFHSPILVKSNQKNTQYIIPVHFTFFWAWMIIAPLFLVPFFVWFYKKNNPLFVISYHASVFMISIGIFYFLFTEDRWFHLLTMGYF